MITFDRTNRSALARWWWTLDRGIYLSLIFLVLFGGITVIASSPSVARRIGFDSSHYIERQIIYLAVSMVIFTAVSFFSPIAIRRISVIGLFMMIVLMVLLPFFGQEVKGAKRWISLGFMSLQPSEFVKPFFAVTAAWIFARGHIQPGFPGYRINIALYAVILTLLIIQPDLGMTVTVSIVWMAQFFLAGLSIFWVACLGIFGLSGVFAAYKFLPHVSKRIDSFINPEASENYQVQKSLEAFANGGIGGVGPGEGKVKNFLPDSHTDFVFSVIGEEGGLIACLLVLAFFAVIIFRGLQKAKKQDDLFIILAIAGLVVQFGAQALINIGVALHLLPTKGMTLPFLSYGGSSSIALAVGMGMLLALTRQRFSTK